jgi:hypothetical protein
LKLAERIGLKLYDKISEQEYAGRSLFGELIFASSVFKTDPWKTEFVEEILHNILDKRYGVATIQPVHYRKIEHERKSYNTSSIVMQQSNFVLSQILKQPNLGTTSQTGILT